MKDSDFRELIEHVWERTDIVEIISEHLTLDNHLKALCPFHDDSVPSLSVNAKERYFHCFGCGEGGDVFTFLELLEGKSFMAVLSELAARAGISVKAPNQADKKRIEDEREVRAILTASAIFYASSLTDDARDYLTNARGLTAETVSENRIGCAQVTGTFGGQDTGLVEHLQSQGYSKNQAVKAGVLYDNGREYFSGCITFPNWLRGEVVYITGRGHPEKSHKKPMKDKLPSGHVFLESVLREKSVIITEGEIDTYTLRQAGFNACGILGISSFKDEWVSKFRNIGTVYISLDGDESGVKAALKLGKLLGRKARIVSFPDSECPDGEMIKDWNELFVTKHGSDIQSFREEYQKLLDDAQTVLEYRIRQIPVDIPKREVPNLLSPIVAALTTLSDIEQDFYIDIIAEHFRDTFKLTRQAIRNDIKRNHRTIAETEDREIEILSDDYTRISPALDFSSGVGYMSVPLDVRLKSTVKGVQIIKLAKVPYLVTSRKEMHELNEEQLLEQKKVILKSKPLFLDSSRWPLNCIKSFQEVHFKVDPCDVFEKVAVIYESYVDFKENHTAEIIALWTIGTYMYPIFESYPYVSFTGERGSGKTKTLNLADKLCFNAVCSSDMSSSLLFRIIEGSSCTVLIDEAERLKDPKQSQEFRLLLNAGYKRGGRAHRSKPDTFEPQSFDVYSPKMIANIRGLEDVLESRCIQFTMLRTKDIEKANRTVTESSEDWSYVRHLLYSFGLGFFEEVQDIYLSDSEVKSIRAISGREGELWHPILAIARFLDRNGCNGLFESLKNMAVKKGEEARSTGLDEWSNAMLLVLRDLTQDTEDEISNREIRDKMAEYLSNEESTPKGTWIGRALKRLGLIRKSKRSKKGYLYVIEHADVVDVMERYGV